MRNRLLAAVAVVWAGGMALGQTSRPMKEIGPAQVMSADEIAAGLKSRDRALYIKRGWIRDPYIVLGPDDFYYLTGTTVAAGDPREEADRYNTGLGEGSIVGSQVRVWRSKDLAAWDDVGVVFDSAKDGIKTGKGKALVWAPELHWVDGKWALIHCPEGWANLAFTSGKEIKGPWTFPMGEKLGSDKHDPSLFKDGERWWMLWKNTFVAPIKADWSGLEGEPVKIDPAGQRRGPGGGMISRIGHEGATMIKVGDRYVYMGTGWSTDRGRKGSYNLYYCTSKSITGPYSERRFAGRFLGHGTPFQDREGNWWCTAFYNGNVPPLPREGIEGRDLAADAQTINPRGTTIVPLEVKVMADGDVRVRALDSAYEKPGPDENQKF